MAKNAPFDIVACKKFLWSGQGGASHRAPLEYATDAPPSRPKAGVDIARLVLMCEYLLITIFFCISRSPRPRNDGEKRTKFIKYNAGQKH